MSDFNPFYDEKYGNNGEHDKVRAACECINANPCSFLRDEVESIKSSVEQLELVDKWPDDAGVNFIENKDSCIRILPNITSSISDLFTQSEQIYIKLLEQLDLLRDLDGKYKEFKERDPRKTKSPDDPGYDDACREYDDCKRELEKTYIDMGNTIDDYMSQLDDINGCTLDENGNISGIDTNIEIPDIATNQVSIPLDLYLDMDLFDIYTDENGEKWYVIHTNVDIFDKIQNGELDKNYNFSVKDEGGKKLGKQIKDKCNIWSKKYANAILESAGKSDKIKITKGYSSEEASDIVKIAFEELCQGNPSILRVTGRSTSGEDETGIYYAENGGTSRHYVTVGAIRAGANLNDLQPSDLGIFDPTSAQLHQLDTTRTTTNDNEETIYIRRSLQDSQSDQYETNRNQYKKGFYIETIGSDKDYEKLMTGVETDGLAA